MGCPDGKKYLPAFCGQFFGRRSILLFALTASLFWTGLFSGQAAADNAYGYILQDSAICYLSEENIADMSPKVLCFARYEIYARYGATFFSDEIQAYFDEQYWYSPVYEPGTFLDDMLNGYEKANVQLLMNREQALGAYEPDGSYAYADIYEYIASKQSDYSEYDVDPDSYIFYDSDERYLSLDEAKMLSLQELCYARNEIYARHGRLFYSYELQNYFDQKNWYYGFIPPDQFSEEVLNDIEYSNAALLEAEEYSRSDGGYVLDQAGYSFNGIGSYRAQSQENKSAVSDDEYIFRDSNTRYLSTEEISSLSLQMLCYARNEIYARRGYIFRSQELRDYFGSKSWYYGTIPAASFSGSVFNEWESANIELLKMQEYSLNPNGYQLY